MRTITLKDKRTGSSKDLEILNESELVKIVADFYSQERSGLDYSLALTKESESLYSINKDSEVGLWVEAEEDEWVFKVNNGACLVAVL